VRPRGFPASSDAAYFGSPVVLFGPGSLAQAHSLDEWVAVADMVTATEVYLRAALTALGPRPTASG
jgi:acetylornithine deacetylase